MQEYRDEIHRLVCEYRSDIGIASLLDALVITHKTKADMMFVDLLGQEPPLAGLSPFRRPLEDVDNIENTAGLIADVLVAWTVNPDALPASDQPLERSYRSWQIAECAANKPEEREDGRLQRKGVDASLEVIRLARGKKDIPWRRVFHIPQRHIYLYGWYEVLEDLRDVLPLSKLERFIKDPTDAARKLGRLNASHWTSEDQYV